MIIIKSCRSGDSCFQNPGLHTALEYRAWFQNLKSVNFITPITSWTSWLISESRLFTNLQVLDRHFSHCISGPVSCTRKISYRKPDLLTHNTRVWIKRKVVVSFLLLRHLVSVFRIFPRINLIQRSVKENSRVPFKRQIYKVLNTLRKN